MRSRFFGASSYDDDDDSSYNDEEEPMDMSGFIGSTTVEQPPVIERRRREPRPEPTASAVTPTSPDMSGIGNMGPRSVPPPTSNIGYSPSIVPAAITGNGSPWNPLWASDNTLGPNVVPVVLKCAGLATLFTGGVVSITQKSIGGVSGQMIIAGSAAYLHPALGLGNGQIANWMGDRAKWQVYGSSILVNGIGAVVFYKILTR